MATQKSENLGKVLGVKVELLRLLDGMDYCLDWKPDESAWSARQVVYHVLDTPSGGINHVLWGILSGDTEEFEIWADRDNITPDRMAYDVEQIREDVDEFFREMEEAIESASPDDFDDKSVLVHLRSRGVDEERTLQTLLERTFDGHRRAHLGQIRDLRDALGM